MLLLLGCLSERADAPPSPGPEENVPTPTAPSAESGRSRPGAGANESTSETSVSSGPSIATAQSPPPPSPERLLERETLRARSVLALQAWRQVETAPVDGGTATLTDLAPAVGAWYLLEAHGQSWHLEDPAGRALDVHLAPDALALRDETGDHRCPVWEELPAAVASGEVYAPLCERRLWLRTSAVGHRTPLEWSTEIVRDRLWGGEQITNLVKGAIDDPEQPASALGGRGVVGNSGPREARISPEAAGRILPPGDLGLPVEAPDGLVVGAWYPVSGAEGVWAGVVEPRFLAPEVFSAFGATTSALSDNERAAYVYSVALDLSAFEIGFELGTDHPRVSWSGRVPEPVHDRALPGPDGFDTLAPLARTGMLDPALHDRLVGVFVGGFKRVHGAFSRGDLAWRNGGSHYGFVQQGVELSRLWPGLATLVVDTDGRLDLRTWRDTDRVERVRHARQNGVPVMDRDPVTDAARAGAFVRSWGLGNWSGSAEGELRTVRGGVCLQESARGRFLVYSYFANATPSAMADVYAAYDCRYGMLLDMNALEHTYFALNLPAGVRHLVLGMEVLDKEKDGRSWQRFVGFPDNRDFFYVLRSAP